ncbi:AraC family transcriptional regulator [Clostridium sp. AF34-13]|uniref:AraC family transcriptional regulator n=1 Tax=Clostridium sp. AF34-13 TaxID=2293012 RepID=UPI0011C21088|nr:AraC family transcriptional regulator [Clostridium sp. AF34-13]
MVTALFQILVTYLSRCCETKSSIESGFQSSNYFSRMFKQTYVVSPKEFRRG